MIVAMIWSRLLGADFHGTLPDILGQLTTKDICILTPFNWHTDWLRMQICGINEKDLDSYSGQTFTSQNNSKTSSPSKLQALFGAWEDLSAYEMAAVENIDTVDKSQGSERQVVIIGNCVDSKPLQAADPHFINVACSQAKHLLVVVGNFSHGLAVNKDWCYILRQARLTGTAVDHQIIETEGQDGEILRDLHEHDFNSKLHDLLACPSHRRKLLRLKMPDYTNCKCCHLRV
jgi:hypothetical protein